jgi:hypothetical protein
VKDYGALRPKVVYNCAIVRSLCANAIKYLGAGVMSHTFHYDMDHRRKEERRKGACETNNWEGTKDHPRCPEVNQPTWDFDYMKGKEWRKSEPIVMWDELDGKPSLRQLAYIKKEAVTEENGEVKIEDRKHKYGVKLTCDEFPAARYAPAVFFPPSV